MKEKLSIPAYIFKPVYSKNITTESIKRQDDILEIDFPVFDKAEVLKTAEQLALRKRRAHDRPIDDLIEIMDNVQANWLDPNYEFRKEAMRVIPMITGQSQKLCELELDGSIQIFKKQSVETFLMNEIGGKEYLENWIPRGAIKLHAQPRGVLYHNLAGNTFNIGLISLFYGMISKNVNLIKLPHEEPYFAVRLAESIAEVDKKLSKEMAILYWSGRRGDIFDELFNSGNVNCVISWGGLRSIEEIRKKAYRYGIKVIDHGPKLSFGIVSEEILNNQAKMKATCQKIATDVVFWNQKACLSPRVFYIMESKRKSSIIDKDAQKEIEWKAFDYSKENPSLQNIETKMIDNIINHKSSFDKGYGSFAAMMKRSAKLLRNEVTSISPLGFANQLAEELRNADAQLPRAHLTNADGMDMVKKREYFMLNYELSKKGKMFTPMNDALDWTVVYMRNPPSLNEIEMCTNRFVIVTRISQLQDLSHLISERDLTKFLQTISVYGSNNFVESVAEEFSLLGACRFPRAGEHNIQNMGAPWDGHFILQNLLRWAFIGFKTLDPTQEDLANSLNLKNLDI